MLNDPLTVYGDQVCILFVLVSDQFMAKCTKHYSSQFCDSTLHTRIVIFHTLD